MNQKTPLTELEKIIILVQIGCHGPKYTFIGNQINRSPNTVKSFFKSFKQHKTLFPPRGPPKSINDETTNGILGSVTAYPTQTLSEISKDFDVSPTKVKFILNEKKINYFKKTAVVELTEKHKNNRVKFSEIFIQYNYFQIPKIIFTDESTFVVILENGGVWRTQGLYPPESFYYKNAHPPSVMIWAGIGPFGYKTKLLRFSGKVNSEYYCRQLEQNGIFEDLNNTFGRWWVWQQDNAPAHHSHVTQNFLSEKVPRSVEWPAKSPDLSPIEQVWDYMKDKIAGRRFNNADELFNALQAVWFAIPPEIIHNYYSSFLARCQTCHEIHGESLNGHWATVHQKHNAYRTKLCFAQNPFNGVLYPYEI